MTKRNRFAKAPWWRFVTSNVCELPRHDKTIGKTFTQSLQGNDVVLFQEADNNFYESVLMKHKNYEIILGSQKKHEDSKIAVLKPLSLVKHGEEQFQKAKAKVSHERLILWAQVHGFPGAPDIILSSRHYWPLAFRYDGSTKARPNKAQAAQQPWRQAEWFRGAKIDLELLTKHAATGLPQVVAGDYNRAKVSAYPKTIGGFKVHSFKHGLDWLHFIDGKDYVWKFPALKKTFKHDTASDHDAFGVRARLVARKK